MTDTALAIICSALATGIPSIISALSSLRNGRQITEVSRNLNGPHTKALDAVATLTGELSKQDPSPMRTEAHADALADVRANDARQNAGKLKNVSQP
jgi:uncharacterized protein YqjF (DUF2071 family)